MTRIAISPSSINRSSAESSDICTTAFATSADPRDFGKPLLHELAGLWRYRIGDFRVLCRIEDERLTVLVVEIAHRSIVYER